MTETQQIVAPPMVQDHALPEVQKILINLAAQTRREEGGIAYGYYASGDQPQGACDAEHWDTYHLKRSLRDLARMLDGSRLEVTSEGLGRSI